MADETVALEYMRRAIRAQEKNNPVSPNDISVDEGGRPAILCGVCGKPKRITKNFRATGTEMGGSAFTFFVPVACDCLKAKNEAGRKEKVEWDRARMRKQAGSLSADCKFTASEKSPEMDKCWRYVQKWDEMREKNIGLLLWGGNGPGKSHAAHCIANALLGRDPPVSVYVKTFAAILSGKFDKSEVLEAVSTASLVIFEDLGAERGNDYALEAIFAIVDERYQARKPTIVTTNLTWAEIENPLDERGNPDMRRKRIYDRIVEMCVPVQFHGASRRDAINAEKTEFVRRTLGL